jgi:formate C-acetyltransferase
MAKVNKAKGRVKAVVEAEASNDARPQRASAWEGFEAGIWTKEINVRDFIHRNYTLYAGDHSFLAPATPRTLKLWEQVLELYKEERAKGGVIDADTHVVGNIATHPAGYIDQDAEKIVGLQTEKPLKRALMPFGGIRLAAQALHAYGYEIDPEIERVFSEYRRTHNQGVFDAYTDEMLRARSSGIITGLPDAYGRGRIIGDYRRVALYGLDRLVEDKKAQKHELRLDVIKEETIRLREELSRQIAALEELRVMAQSYGYDISKPATNAREAVQWTYFAYLAAIKEQNGAAMSIGRIGTFLDIYFERDLQDGLIDESEAQELIDDLVIKLRMVRFLRPPEYNELFSGDPTWVTEAIGGVGVDGRSLVTKTSFRVLHTLTTLGPAPEPNLTVLWSHLLPQGFKDYCALQSIATSAIQYENDDLMRPYWGDDYSIACCVSAMRTGKQMQFFGARVNMAKALLYAINGGRDELSGKQVATPFAPITSNVLDYDEVMSRFEIMLDWLAGTYVNALNVIHYMHDRYAYERVEMALHDMHILRTMACGIAGLSVVADSLAAIKYAKVHVIRDETGLAVDYRTDGEFPAFGNDDDRVDDIATSVVKHFMEKLRQHPTYRDAMHTQSVLTITSNVVYGKKTGSTPDGRKAGDPFAPGANPMHGRDRKGALASMRSVAKISYDHAQDGISYTFSIVPKALGKTDREQVSNMVGLLDGYFGDGGQHINVNVFTRETLQDAMDHPEKYPQLTIRVSGYAVNFIKLTREQQQDVLERTFHDKLATPAVALSI